MMRTKGRYRWIEHIPASNMGQVLVIGISHGSQEVITGNSLPIMALEVQVHALPAK